MQTPQKIDIHSEEFLHSLMRKQLKLSITCALSFLIVVLGLPLANYFAPELMAKRQPSSVVSNHFKYQRDRAFFLAEGGGVSMKHSMAEGRVAHQGAMFVFSDLVVRTSGSVGLDESLDLIAEIPIKDEWLASDGKLLGSLKGKSVQIPIRGTLTKPQLDNRVLAGLARDIGTSAVGSLLEEQLKGKVPDKLDGVLKQGLDQLFAPKKKK